MNDLLPIALSAAVPLWQAELAELPWAEVEACTVGVADLLAERGDVLLFGGGKKGEVNTIFNRLAKAIAAMSFLPGGIRIFGCHWEAKHPDLGEKP